MDTRDALVVPADPSKPTYLINLDAGQGSLSNLQREVGGLVDVVAFPTMDIWVGDEGRIDGSPVNVRASHYALNDSPQAKAGRATEYMVLYGDAVVTGPPDRNGDSTAVPYAAIVYFQGLELSQDALRDWDVRSTEVHVTSWPAPPRGAREITNADRAEMALEALQGFADKHYNGYDADLSHDESLQTVLGDFLADARHLAEQRRLDIDRVIENSREVCAQEIEAERDLGWDLDR